MATASVISPSEGKALYMRMQALLVDGGTIVLRSLLESKRPDSQWNAFLNQHQTKTDVKRLRNQEVINPAQFHLLYPSVGTTDRSKYDISLIACLLRNLCGLNARSAVWTGVPTSSDVSEEADIRRLVIERNELAHRPSASITRPDFEVQWKHIEDVLVRLGGNIPDLKLHIDRLKEENIDPEKEKELKDITQKWEESDKSLQVALQEVNTKLQKHSQELDDLHNSDKGKHEELIKIQGQVDSQEQEIRTLTKKGEEADDIHKTLESGLLTAKQDISEHKVETGRRFEDNERSWRETRDFIIQNDESWCEKPKTSDELKSLISITKMFLDDCLSDKTFVKTSKYNEAKKKLDENNLVVLSGHPGEGKTTMAMKLMLEVTDIDKCLRLSQPSDWRLVDVDKFETVFIEDIFGQGVVDNTLVKGWDRYLSEIWKAIQKGKLKVIIATRNYILEEARREMVNRHQMLKEEHVQFLSSKDLTKEERTQMLEAHMRCNDKMTEDSDSLVRSCAEELSDFFFPSRSDLFGFPECVSMFVQNEDLFQSGVSMFVQNEDLFQSGSSFFLSEIVFFWNKLNDLRKDKEKFLVLLIMWTMPNKVIRQSHLEAPYEKEFIDTISYVTSLFGFTFREELCTTLTLSLKLHVNGYIRYSQATGAYSFSHEVISDMVGLVISEIYPKVCLQFTDRDFLFNFITIDESKKTGFRFYVEPRLHESLMQTFIRVEMSQMSSLGVHDAFTVEEFVEKFVKYIVKNNQLYHRIGEQAIELPTSFCCYGLFLQKIDICWPLYSLFMGNEVLFMEMLKQRIFPIDSDETYMALLISAHNNQIGVVDALINNGVKVSQEAIYLAAVRNHIQILERLLQTSPENMITKCQLDKNSALIVAIFHVAVWKKNKEMIGALFEIYLDISPTYRAIVEDEKEVGREYTPLFAIIDKFLSGIAKLLLPQGNVSAKDEYYVTLLSAVYRKGDSELTQEKANPDMEEKLRTLSLAMSWILHELLLYWYEFMTVIHMDDPFISVTCTDSDIYDDVDSSTDETDITKVLSQMEALFNNMSNPLDYIT